MTDVGPVLGASAGSDRSDPPDGWARVLAAAGIGTWRWDMATGVVHWDERLEALAGLPPGTFGSTFEDWERTLHPDERDHVLCLVEQAIELRAPYHFEHRVVRPGGSVRWLECRGEVTTDPRGEVTGTVGAAFDITERKQSDHEREELLDRSHQLADRLARLARISGLLAGALSFDDVGRIVVEHLAAPSTTSSRGLWIVDEQGTTLEMRAGVGFPDATGEAFRCLSVHDDLPIPEAFRERRTVWSPTVEEAERRYPSLQGVPRSSPGFVVAPLTAGALCVGVVVVGLSEASLSDVDLDFIEATAGYLGQAVARLRLSDAVARRASELADIAARERRRRERLEFLSVLTRTAIVAEEHQDLMRRVAAAAVPRLGDWCSLHFEPEGPGSAVTALAHVDPERVEWAERLRQRYPFDRDAEIGVPAVMRTGRTEFIPGVDEETIKRAAERSRVDEGELREILEALHLTSVITVPLVSKRGVLGAVQFVSAESGRRYDEDDVALAEAAAGRIADALDNAWLTDRHRDTAGRLQRALLPPELPRIVGIEVAARYSPAGATYRVGGDFYDLFPVGPDSWAVVIGDVCGSGPDAAAVTAIARHTVRAAARHDVSPSGVLDWTNDAVRHSGRGLFCTACYGTIEAGSERWRLRVAAAGHPLPVVRRRSGETAPFGKPGTLLGVFPEIETTVTELDLEPDDVVLFYTDGMTDLPPPHGISDVELAGQFGSVESRSPDRVLDSLLAMLADRVPDESRRDDVALLALRIAGSPPRAGSDGG